MIFPDAELDHVTAEPTRQWCALAGLPAPPLLLKVQKQWDKPVVDLICREMLTAAQLSDKARLLAVMTKESGLWLNAVPVPNLGLLLDDDCLRVSVALRLGGEVCRPHACRCGAQVDRLGHHGLCCKYSAGRQSRHSAINGVVRRALVSASVPAILEPPGLERENGKRPDGMTQVPWMQGKALVWDVTCVDTLCKSNIVGSLSAAGYASGEAEKKKCWKYRHLEGRFLFAPLAFETFGPWGPMTRDLIFTIGNKITERTGEKRASEFLRQRISIDVQRGNAECVLGTHPSARDLGEIFYVLKTKH